MGTRLDQIDNPVLRARIQRAIDAANEVRGQLKVVCPSPSEATIKMAKKRVRQSSKPLMNKLEAEFFNHMKCQYLEIGYGSEILAQALRFRLGNGIWYKPDFVQIRPSGRWTIYEVKGPHAFRGGLENLKIAASQYPLIQWVLAWKEGGEWVTQEIFS